MTLKRSRKMLLIVILSLISFTSALGSVFSYAWLSTRGKVITNDGNTQYAVLGMKLDLLFDMLQEDKVSGKKILTQSDGTEVTYDAGATWGTAANPYIISDIRHLQNLSILQEIGYFDDLYISKNYDGKTYNEGTNIPYFLVCNPNGTPATINGNGVEFSPIGSDQYPFIGYVGGAFVEGTTAADDSNTSKVSVLKNINVKTTTDVTDVGLFGIIGYLGDDKFDANGDLKTGNISGMPSTVKDLLLYDVHVTVTEHSWVDVVRHLFTFWEVSAGDKDKVPHENHHIGIFAGHIELANVENISVFYSDDNMVAIDLLHKTVSDGGTVPNYLSVTGITGYIYSMNPEYNGSTIGLGSGIGNADFDVTTGGVGSGGGSLTGMGRGYVVASTIYDSYKYSANLGNQTLYLFYDEDMNSANGIMLHKRDGDYYLEDDKTVVNVSAGKASFSGFETENFFIRTEAVVNDETVYTYYFKNETTEVIKFNATDMLLISATDENGKALCTRYVRKRLLWGTEETNNYYFYDGVFTFALSSPSDSISDTWDNHEVDEFVLGGTNDSDWKTNTAKGNKAMVGYVHQITNNEELNTAIAGGKQLFIMEDFGDGNVFVMTLFEQSVAGDGLPDEKYSTSGINLMFDDVDDSDGLTQSLIQSYEGGLALPANMSSSYNTLDEFKAGIESGNLKVINLGSASAEGYSISQIEQRFQIKAKAVGSYSYTYENGTPVTIADNATTIKETYDFEGYFYYTAVYRGTDWDVLNQYRDYYYVDADGVSHVIREKGSTTVTNIFQQVTVNNNNKTEQDENIYYATVDGQRVEAVVINWETTKFHSTNTTAMPNGGIVSKQVGNNYAVFMKDPDGRYYYNGAEVSIRVNGTTAQGKTQYTDGTRNGIIINRYPVYTLSNGDNYLRLIEAKYTGALSTNLGTYYSIWNGTDSYATTANNFRHQFAISNATPTLKNNPNATIVFNNDSSGSCYIEYFIGTTQRYVSYDNQKFKSATVKTNAKLYIYSVEGMQDIEYGRITFDPKVENNDLHFSADEFVLWPKTTLTGQNISNNKKTADPIYVVKQLAGAEDDAGWTQRVTSENDLLTIGNGWKNSKGEQLTSEDLNKKFSLGAGIAGSTYTVSLFGGNLSLGDSNIVRAPVGSAGVEADIPIGCVAFRINKTGESKIRVIVAVAQSEQFYGEAGNPLDYADDYYFALWQAEAAGSSLLTNFALADALEVFEIPRSTPYQPGTTASGADNTAAGVSKYINVQYNNTAYRCYLNGNRILVGYEFTVSNEGVYIMGCTQPMEIVYFSADGTSSAGRDGSGGSKLGSIDFVYEYDNKIITVSEESIVGEEDYNYYYASLALLYSENSAEDNGFVDINDCQVFIKREIAVDDQGKEYSRIVYHITSEDAEYIKVTRYAAVSDQVERGANGARS